MPLADIEVVFLEAASEVLETMFFTSVAPEGPLAQAPASRPLSDTSLQDDSVLSADLAFSGKVSGSFGVRVARSGARRIAANFLGADEATDEQAVEVVCELSNMLCGSILSRLEGEARFDLKHPELDPSNTDWRTHQHAAGCTFSTEEGELTMWIAFDESHLACPAA